MSIIQRKHLAAIFNAALAAVDPYHAVTRAVKIENNCLHVAGAAYDLDTFNRILVVGAGKAAARMAQAAEEILGDVIADGLIIVKEGQRLPIKKIRQIEAGHPIPDEAGVKGTHEIITMLEKADGKTLVLCLLSGGGSALLVSPADGITLRDKQGTTDLMLRSGATIEELNAVRKHLSRIKGGLLARIAYPATIMTLILSDVIGDRLDVIASGPTAPDTTTFRDAANVIQRYNLMGKLPGRVETFLGDGISGKLQETPKQGDYCFSNAFNIIIGGLKQSIAAAQEAAGNMGYDTEIITSELRGEARDAAKTLASAARSRVQRGRPICILSGGETTVTVKGTGKGGRNQELALAFALEIEGTPGLAMLSAGTDGTDGPTDAAGAIVDGETATKARSLGLDPSSYLENNDSYTFFHKLDSLSGERHHLITGPTGTNVMDVQIVIIK